MKKTILAIIAGFICFASGYFVNQNNKIAQGNNQINASFTENPANQMPNTTARANSDFSNSNTDRLNSSETETIKLFEEAAPSVVFINTSTYSRTSYFSADVTEIPQGSGTGFVWDKKGNIITNYHVIKNAQKITVTLSDGTIAEGKLVGKAPSKDLAVVHIDVSSSKLRPIPRGQSNNLRVGQFVFAIGNPFGLDQTLTTGIVSALGREIQSPAKIKIKDVIQTDAAINPGNSGGPLLNSSGELIGVNTAIYSPSGGSAGIGFSIPADVVKSVIPDLLEFGELQRPVLGIEPLHDYYTQRFGIKGVAIQSIYQNSPAQRAGLLSIYKDQRGNVKLGDIITGINDDAIKNMEDLLLTLEKYKPNQEVTLNIKRSEKKMNILITLAAPKDVYDRE